MNIRLELIKPSPKPIRTTWDEDKLDELAQSIEEQGLIVPIKVRPNSAMKNFIAEIPGWYKLYSIDNNDMSFDEYKEKKINNPYGWNKAKFEIVYGHRRVAAMRIAGFNETDAIVEGLNDDDAQWQSLIENLQREDLSDIDKANGINNQRDRGYTIEEIARKTGYSTRHILRLLTILDEPEEVQTYVTNGHVSEPYVREMRESGLDKEDHVTVLDKTIREGLTAKQTRKVAESVAATKDPKKRKYLLDTEFSGFLHDPEIVAFEESIPKEKSKPDLGSAFDPTPEVGWVLEYLSAWTKKVDKFVDATEAGKFSPEAQAFTARRAQKFVNKLSDWIEILEGENV